MTSLGPQRRRRINGIARRAGAALATTPAATRTIDAKIANMEPNRR